MSQNTTEKTNGYHKPAQTLCWDCQMALKGCNWSRNFEPVEGWTAIPTKINDYTDSYCVLDCPLFLRDKPRRKLEEVV